MTGRSPPSGSMPEPDRSGRRTVAIVAMTTTLLLGGIATTLAIVNERRTSAETNKVAAGEASDSISRQVSGSLLALKGIDGLAIDGNVSREEFAAFAKSVVPSSAFSTLAREDIVRNSEREAFERRTGLTIVERNGAGGLVPAATRSEYVVIVDVNPVNDVTRRLLGFDIASESARNEARQTAAASGEPAVGRPISLVNTARPGLFVIAAARNSQQQTVGFISSGLSIDNLVATAQRTMPKSARMGVSDAATPLTAPVTDGETSMIDIGGRRWTVVVAGAGDPNYRTAAIVLAVSLLLAGLLLFGLRRDATHRRRNETITTEMIRSAKRSTALADIAHRMASARTATEVNAIIVDHVPDAVGADHANVGFIEFGNLVMADLKSGLPAPVHSRYRSVPINSDIATARAARTGETVLIDDLASYQRESGLDPDTDSTGIASLAAVSLRRGDGTVTGVLGLAWKQRVTFDPNLIDTLGTLGELCGQTIVRAELSDLRLRTAQRAGLVANLASALAGATTIEEVSDIVATSVASLLGTTVCTLTVVDLKTGHLQIRSMSVQGGVEMDDYVSVGVNDLLPRAVVAREGAPLSFVNKAAAISAFPGLAADLERAGIDGSAFWPLRNSHGDVAGVLGLGWGHPLDLDEPLKVAIQTAVDLCSQALERAQLYDAEHSLVDALQQRLLVAPPHVAGLDIHALYLPATQLVSMGGDWYEGALLADGRLAMVVGDVVGHGVEAAADMSQIRNVVSALLRSGTDPAQIFPLVSELLHDDRMVTATAMIAWIDREHHEIRYVSAGHPPAMVKHPDGRVEVLHDGRQSLLGVRSEPVAPGRCEFAPGSTLVLYTDGLVERRTEDIFTSIDALAERLVAISETSATGIATVVVDQSMQRRDQDDDIAVVVVCHLPGMPSD